MGLVLYRKYRPQTFGEIVGQEHVVQTLRNAIATGMVSHAYLFAGPRGSGKTTIARIFAKAVNCTARKGAEPCNKCDSCTEITQGHSLDLIEIDAASHRGIDEVRELRDGIKFAPAKSKYKVFILDEAHQLSKDAVNALLKTLEEPPSHAIFILATTEIQKMLPTIVSRCQRFDFRKLTLPEILKRLEIIVAKEKAKIEKAALELIALNSGGAIRDAESLLDQALTYAGVLGKGEQIQIDDIKTLLGLVDIKAVGEFVDFLVAKNGGVAIEFLGKLFEAGYDPQEFARALIRYTRQLLLVAIDPKGSNRALLGLTKEEQEKIRMQAARFTREELSKMITLFMDAENKMKYASIPQLPIELAIVDIVGQK